jgi:sugar lactone lactonase YvrE
MNCRLIWLWLAGALASGQTITNFAGNGTVGYSGDLFFATQAMINHVVGLASDASGNIYLADQNNNVVRKVDTGGVITTFAGSGVPGFAGDSGPATSAQLNAPQGVCVAPSGVVYVNDPNNNRVRAIATDGKITTVAGSAATVTSGDSGPANTAGLVIPVHCAVDESGNLFIVDQGASLIRKVNTSGIITTFAGINNAAGFSGDNGLATAAMMNHPTAAAFDSSGNLYVTDQFNHRIRKIDTNGIITTVAGNGQPGFFGDGGPATSASLNFPGEIAVDSSGNLFIVDTMNEVIRQVTPGGTISTVAGIHGTIGIGGDGGPPLSAQFNNPIALALDPTGNLYVGDTNNNRVRKISSLAAGRPPCTYALSSGGQTFTAAGGNGSVNITAGTGCVWTPSNTPGWMFFTGAPASGGNGTLTYQVAANSGTDRAVTLAGNGLLYTVEQQGGAVSNLNFPGSLAHLAAEENWTSTLTLFNKSVFPATSRLSFFGDAADPTGSGPLTLPLIFPQQAAVSGPILAQTFDRPLAAKASLIVTTAGPQSTQVLVGSAQLASTNEVDGFAIFHQIPTGQEAVVPMENRRANSYLLAFDNTSGLVLGVAVQNASGQQADIPVIVRDDTGATISTGTNISLAANGHTSFVLSDQFPVTANKRGTIEFDTPPGSQISVLGLRFSPPNSALTTIPALANVIAGGGGSIAHFASGGDGWQTTFVLVNVGTTATSATLSFFADQTGAPLTLPLAFPQTGSGPLTVPVYTTQLAAGQSQYIVSTGTQALLTGSAQLVTAGTVSGFVIFRHNNQEAVVPLESRHATAYFIAFDNTNGTSTGIAVNAVSAGPVSIPVVVRDDAGGHLAIDTLNLAANGHAAFTLALDKYPNTANIRGTIEFDTPVGAAIGALGIRIPAGAVHSYTTLPALAQ